MRILKMTGLALLTMSMISSCTSTKNVADSKIRKMVVPAPLKTVVNISKKKAKLTDNEAENWQHLDLATDTIPGMSVNKAYEFLKGKKSTPIVVCVLDSGTDLKHEDLKDVAWVNTKEIAGNGIDDDKNGFVDDITGWNFLGDTNKEHLEWERILMNPSKVSPELLAEVKKYQAEKIKEEKAGKGQIEQTMAMVEKADELLTKHFGKKDYTKEDVKNLKTSDPKLVMAQQLAGRMLGYFDNVEKAKEYFKKALKKSDDLVSGNNLKTDYRKTGDNSFDIKDKFGYGNGNTGHMDKHEAHGSHVSGIIAASRNNGKGMNGVADNVKIMAVRSVPDGDEYDKDIALGIRYAVDNGAKIINTSFGKAFSPNKEWVYDAIKYAGEHDVLIVNAAGNDAKNIDIEKTFPNDAPDLMNEISDNFLTVGASTYFYDEKLPASFSNYGKKNVDVFGPGYQIYSTTPEKYYPQLSASQVKHIIMNSGTEIPFKVNKPGTKELVPFSDLSVSGRVANAYNALKMADQMVNGK